MGSVRQRKDGIWEGRYVEGHDPKTGKLIRKSVYGKTQSEVVAKLKKLAVVDEPVAQLPIPRMTVIEWLDIWIGEYCGNVKPLTLVSYKSIIERHIAQR